MRAARKRIQRQEKSMMCLEHGKWPTWLESRRRVWEVEPGKLGRGSLSHAREVGLYLMRKQLLVPGLLALCLESPPWQLG